MPCDPPSLVSDRATPLRLRSISDEETASFLAYVKDALGEREAGQPVGFLYDIEIEPRFRRCGLGRQAMLLVEEEARPRGFSEIRLNVFGRNEIARSLYRSLGYEEFAIAMRKPLS